MDLFGSGEGEPNPPLVEPSFPKSGIEVRGEVPSSSLDSLDFLEDSEDFDKFRTLSSRTLWRRMGRPASLPDEIDLQIQLGIVGIIAPCGRGRLLNVKRLVRRILVQLVLTTRSVRL